MASPKQTNGRGREFRRTFGLVVEGMMGATGIEPMTPPVKGVLSRSA